MIEMRWKIERWEEYRDGLQSGITRTEEPVLQYRVLIGHVDASGAINVQPGPKYTDWMDVPTEYVET